MKVLYVEDNPANVFLVKRVARMGNHEIINYIDGGQALKKYDEISPDLVLMDIQLAGDKTGLDVVRELRARGVRTPIIAVTAYAMVGDKERCLEAGCDDYLAKPLPIPRLVEIFESYSKAFAAALAAAPKVEPAPKAEAAPAPVGNASEALPSPEITPKIATAPLVDKNETAEIKAAESTSSDKAANTVAQAKTTDAAPNNKAATGPLSTPAEIKTAEAAKAPETVAVEAKPLENKAAPETKVPDDSKKEAEQSNVKPEASSS